MFNASLQPVHGPVRPLRHGVRLLLLCSAIAWLDRYFQERMGRALRRPRPISLPRTGGRIGVSA